MGLEIEWEGTVGPDAAGQRLDQFLAEPLGSRARAARLIESGLVELDGHAAWQLPAGPEGFATSTLHAAYLHTHWAGHPALARRFAQAVHKPSPR